MVWWQKIKLISLAIAKSKSQNIAEFLSPTFSQPTSI